MDHLVARHRNTLMAIHMPCAYVSGRRLQALVDEKKLPFLEELELCVRTASLVSDSRG